ncbi:toxin-antitoxin system HicB family antitoxin [Mechercharimyces sp. CAU 1602]|uniref:toxin-antitoxin system HicB family antitoxin n=1 Tax=Mechercharimyces sp. CAU 1602 TaxID=2973933 RepID=UPI0037C71F5C
MSEIRRAFLYCASCKTHFPEPTGSDENYSGKTVVRMPKSLHKRLAIVYIN